MATFIADWLESCRRKDLDTHDSVAWVKLNCGLAGLVADAYSSASPQGRPPAYDRLSMTMALLYMQPEAIPNFEALARRLRGDDAFAERCGFGPAQRRPHGWDLRRHFRRLTAREFGKRLQAALVAKAQSLGLLTTDSVAVDSTPIHTRQRWRKNAAPTAGMSASERSVHCDAQARQRRKDVYELPYTQLVDQLPRSAGWGQKTNSRGQVERWFGYKLHIAVDCGPCEIPLAAIFTSADCHDHVVAYPLAIGVRERLGRSYRYGVYDSAYDAIDLYKFHDHHGEQMLGALNWRGNKPPPGLDRDCHPQCIMGRQHRYHSHDAAHRTLRFGLPADCPGPYCALWERCREREIRVAQTDPRRHICPPRGSETFKRLYARRSTIERVNAGIKEHGRADACLLKQSSPTEAWVDLSLAIWTAKKIVTALKSKQRGRPPKRPRRLRPQQLRLDRHAIGLGST